MSVYVIRAFIQLREKVATNAAILKRLAEIDKTLLQHDTALRHLPKTSAATCTSARAAASANRIFSIIVSRLRCMRARWQGFKNAATTAATLPTQNAPRSRNTAALH